VILPADVAEYLLLHVRRDIPSLVEALERLREHAMVTKRKLTIRLAREALAMTGV
jgi:chromosomal replication initiator protein